MAARWLGRRKAICCVAILVVLVAIGLGVGLGVGLSRRAASASSASTAPASCTTPGSDTSIQLSLHPPANASVRLAEAFVSFAFEFASFSLFAGNKSSPGTFSDNLLKNIGDQQGTRPYVRVGGSSSDFAILDPSLDVTVTGRIPVPQPVGTQMLYRDSFFESFETWADTKFIYGFDLAHIVGGNEDAGWNSLDNTVPLICKALLGGRLAAWEFGNEPNLYKSSLHDVVGDNTWNEDTYISTWKNGTESIRQQLKNTPECTALGDPEQFHFIGPSMWLPDNTGTGFSLEGLWSGGYDSENLIQEVSMHRYLKANKPTDTIASALLNHTKSRVGLADALNQYAQLPSNSPPLVLGESNSLSPIGKAGVTDTLGGALWALDWALWSASQNVTRVHFQQGDNFHYNAWQPETDGQNPLALQIVSPGTKPPYYGHMAAAHAVGNSGNASVQVLAIDMQSEVDVAYAVYANGALARVALLNLREFSTGSRPSHSYMLNVPSASGLAEVAVRRLVGPSSDALAGVQWDGNQYELPNQGLPSQPNNVTTNERFKICNGQVTVQLDDSSAAVLEFMAM